MNFILAVLQFLILLGVTLSEYCKKYLSVFLWATVLVLFGIPHLLTIMMGVSNYDEQTMNKASIFVILFCMLYFITRSILGVVDKNKHKISKNISGTGESINYKDVSTIAENRINTKMEYFFLLFLFISIAVLIFYSVKYFGGVFNASWGRFYILNRDLGSRSLIRYTQFLFFASAGVILVFKNDKKKTPLLLSIFLVLIYPILTGNRITILPLLVSIILMLIYNNRKRISLKKVVFLGCFGMIAIYTIYFLKLLRIYGGFSPLFNRVSIISMNEMVFEMILNGEGELGLRNAFYYFIEKDNMFLNFNKGHTYIRLLFMVVPTSLSGGFKPTDFAISMGSAWSNNFSNTNYSMHPTLFGDVFANFWFYGIVWGVFWAIFASIIDRVSNQKNEIVKIMSMVVFGVMYIIIARGSVYNAIFQAFISIVIIHLIYFVSRIKVLK